MSIGSGYSAECLTPILYVRDFADVMDSSTGQTPLQKTVAMGRSSLLGHHHQNERENDQRAKSDEDVAEKSWVSPEESIDAAL